jgi:hypothetical protein
MEKTLIEYSFNMLNQIKLYHWATVSYAKHKALDELHSVLSNHFDTLIEAYMGYNNLQPLKQMTIDTKCNTDTENITKFIQKSHKQLTKLHKAIKQSEMQNIIDEMLSALNKTLYLLKLE